MDTVNHFTHAYKQAPWRKQRQWVSLFLLTLLGFAMVASLYLMVTSQAALRGREIQVLREEILKAQYANVDLQTELGKLTSREVIEQRATDLGLRPAQPEELQYLQVPGYEIPQAAFLASVPELRPSAPSVPPEFNQSLLDWLDERLQVHGGLP